MTVVEVRRVDEVLVAGEPVTDRPETVLLGDAVVGELRQPEQRDRDQVLGPRLLFQRDAGNATQQAAVQSITLPVVAQSGYALIVVAFALPSK